MPSTDNHTTEPDRPPDVSTYGHEPRGQGWSGRDWLLLILGILGALGAIPLLRDVWVSLTEIPGQVWGPVSLLQNLVILAALAVLLYRRGRH